jgi:hypothetical protein
VAPAAARGLVASADCPCAACPAAPAASLKKGADCIALLPRDDISSTLGVSLDRRFLDVVSPERTFTGVGAHYCVTGAIVSCGMACLTGRPGASQGYHGTGAPYAKASEKSLRKGRDFELRSHQRNQRIRKPLLILIRAPSAFLNEHGEYPFGGATLCLLTSAEFRIPSLKSGAQLVIEGVHPHLQ